MTFALSTDPDPTVRLNIWGVVIGDAIGTISAFGFNQVAVQRYSSLPSLAKARAYVDLYRVRGCHCLSQFL